MRRILLPARRLAGLTLAGLLAAGCASKPPADFVRTHLDSRLRSFSTFPSADFPEGNLETYTTLRTVFVVSSRRPVRLTPNPRGPSANGPMLVHPFTGIAGSGAGVPIDRRGYLLTANHVLADTGPVQVARTDGSRILIATARVVWRGKPSRGEPDLALLCLPGGFDDVYTWSETIPATGPVLGVGKNWSSDRQRSSEFRFQFYAGTVTGWETAGANPAWQTLAHNAPAFPGDSGGPLLDARGRLLAISTQGGLRYDTDVANVADATAYGTGARPNLTWLEQLIESDAKAHPPTGP